MSIKPDSFANSLGKETALEKRDLLTNSDFFFLDLLVYRIMFRVIFLAGQLFFFSWY